ncbi:MAG TPA: CBS domain-containing protein, partial [Gemmatimonadaceae bacterium]
IERPQRLLAAAGTGVAAILLAAGIFLGARVPAPTLVGRVLVFALLAIAFGQIFAREIARRWPTVLAPFVLPVLGAAEVASRPLSAFGRMIASPSRKRTSDAALSASRDPIQDLLREGELEGVGAREEIAIISGVVEFSEKTVGDVMRPRADIFAVSDTMTPHEMAAGIAKAGYSRVPVYHGSLDAVVGMIHVFDVLKSYGESMPRIRPVAYAVPTDACNELLFRMLPSRLHLAIVRDAANRTIGLVTLEDLLEELVGDIRDEHDEPEAKTR